jgi:hypothetical protein
MNLDTSVIQDHASVRNQEHVGSRRLVRGPKSKASIKALRKFNSKEQFIIPSYNVDNLDLSTFNKGPKADVV